MDTMDRGYKAVMINAATGAKFTQPGEVRVEWAVGRTERLSSPEFLDICHYGLHYAVEPLETLHYFESVTNMKPEKNSYPRLAVHHVTVPSGSKTVTLETAIEKRAATALTFGEPVTGRFFPKENPDLFNWHVQYIQAGCLVNGLLHSLPLEGDDEWILPSLVIRKRTDPTIARWYVHGECRFSHRLHVDSELLERWPDLFQWKPVTGDKSGMVCMHRSVYERLLGLSDNLGRYARIAACETECSGSVHPAQTLIDRLSKGPLSKVDCDALQTDISWPYGSLRPETVQEALSTMRSIPDTLRIMSGHSRVLEQLLIRETIK